jgi:acyl-CoA synthetase (AMP-forming)/AMP-acid ligase II
MAIVSVGVVFQNLAANNPHVDVIRYHHKNEKWTLKHVNHFADALAIGFLDNGLIPGDVVLSWLPLHFSEQHILQFACSKAGLVLYNLDPTVACTDKESAKKSLAKALELTEANVLITQEAGNDVNYVHLVESVIPETRIFDFGEGMPFFTPRFPHLRFPIHTGFDYEDKGGMVPLKDMLCPSGQLSSYLGGFKIDGSTPLMGSLQVGSDGVPTGKGKVLTNEEVVKGKIWPEFNSILEKKYIEVEGVGVVF